MNDRQFSIILGFFLTFVILAGVYFIGNYLAPESETNLQDRKTLNQVNQTVNEILSSKDDDDGGVLPPVQQNTTTGDECDNSTTTTPVIENITGNTNSLYQC